VARLKAGTDKEVRLSMRMFSDAAKGRTELFEEEKQAAAKSAEFEESYETSGLRQIIQLG
jgi:hypothetical protein